MNQKLTKYFILHICICKFLLVPLAPLFISFYRLAAWSMQLSGIVLYPFAKSGFSLLLLLFLHSHILGDWRASHNVYTSPCLPCNLCNIAVTRRAGIQLARSLISFSVESHWSWWVGVHAHNRRASRCPGSLMLWQVLCLFAAAQLCLMFWSRRRVDRFASHRQVCRCLPSLPG